MRRSTQHKEGHLVSRLVLAGLCLSAAFELWAGSIIVKDVSTYLDDKVHFLDARIEYKLTEPMYEALHKGVPLTFVLTIEVARPRDYLWDDSIAELEQRYQLEYQMLTQQYLVRNLNSGSLFSLPALDVALSVLGTVVALPLIDHQLLDESDDYEGYMRVQLDIEELPVPLRLLSYFSSEWRLRSEWFRWPLQR